MYVYILEKKLNASSAKEYFLDLAGNGEISFC